jgi:membrane dipeptidase
MGRYTKEIDYGEGSSAHPGFPPMPIWFEDSRHFQNVADGLSAVGFNDPDIARLMGENWLSFFDHNFGPA